MPVTVKTFATSGEAAAALSSERDARYLGGGTLVMRALNEGDLSVSTVVRATDRALTHLDIASSRIGIGAGVTFARVLAERELAFLHPLPVERLWGVGAKTADKLHDRGITTVGEVARIAEAALVAMLGRASGRHLHALAHNRDPRPVEVGRRRRSIGSQRALGRGPRSRDEIDTVLVGLVDRVTRRMRAAGRVGRTVVLRLRFDDFSRVTRSHTMPRATAETLPVLTALRALLVTATPIVERRGLTLVGVAVGNLDDDGAVQLTLPFDRRSGGALDAALDDVRERFGFGAVTRAVLLGRDEGLSVPLLPD